MTIAHQSLIPDPKSILFYSVPSYNFSVPSSQLSVPSFQFLVHSFRFLVFSSQFPVSCSLIPVSCALFPYPWSLIPDPWSRIPDTKFSSKILPTTLNGRKKPSKRCNSASVGMSCTNIEVCFFLVKKWFWKFSAFSPHFEIKQARARRQTTFFSLHFTPIHWIQLWQPLLFWKEEGWTGFPRAGRAAPRDFPRTKADGNPEMQPCQPEEKPRPSWLFYLDLHSISIGHFGDLWNFSNIDLWRSILVAK